MSNIISRLKPFLVKNQLLITICIPLFFIAFTLYFVFYPSKVALVPNTSVVDNPSPSPTSTPIINKVNPDLGNKNPLDSRPGLIKKEALQGNATKYTFNSGQADHPNIIITNSNNNIVFQSTITDPSLPIKISDYTESYGQPKFIFIGTKSYGSQSRIYIYAELGIAFIADPQTGNVLEQQVFNPTKVDDYVRNYGQDIQAQP